MTSSERNRPRPLAIDKFDPEPSLLRALELLTTADVPFALIGRLAVWVWVSADEQEFTKDVDVAVPLDYIETVCEALRRAGHVPLPLPIGGVALRDGGIRIDFIDRRIDFAALYAEAVADAGERGVMTLLPDGREVPVAAAEYIAAMKLATGNPHDERDVERLLSVRHFDYERCRQIARRHLGPGSANRLDHVGARVGVEAAARYVRASNGL